MGNLDRVETDGRVENHEEIDKKQAGENKVGLDSGEGGEEGQDQENVTVTNSEDSADSSNSRQSHCKSKDSSSSSSSSPSPASSPSSSPSPSDGQEGRIFSLASADLEKSIACALGPGRELFYYDSGAYHQDADDWIQRWFVRWVDKLKSRQYWSSRMGSELVRWMTFRSPRLWDIPPIDRINLANCSINPSTLQISHLSPDWLSTVQIPVEFDPLANDGVWERFLSDLFPEGAMDLAWEIVGASLLPNKFLQQAIWLHGSGSNGKSTFIDALVGLVGRKNVCRVGLKELESSRFSAAGLYGKLLNVDPDADHSKLAGTSLFKKIVAGEEIQVERKHRDPCIIRPFCTQVMGGNNLPESTDSSYGYYRRWVIVPFVRNFEADGQGSAQAMNREKLLAALAHPRSLSSALNLALRGLQRVIAKGKFSEGRAVAEAAQEFQRLTDPMWKFIDEWIGEQIRAGNMNQDGEVYVTREGLAGAYNNWAGMYGMGSKTVQDLLAWVRRNGKGTFWETRMTGEGREDGKKARPWGWRVVVTRWGMIREEGGGGMGGGVGMGIGKESSKEVQ